MEAARIVEALEGRTLPAAVVDLQAFDHNVGAMAELAGAMRVRVATKSLRVPALLQRVLAHGPPYAGLMTYSAPETLALAELGFDDFLLAYPTHSPADLQALRQVHQRGCTVRAMVDSAQGIAAVAKTMDGVARPFPVVLDLCVALRPVGSVLHMGVRRSPLRSVDALLELARSIQDIPALCLGGVMAYEAQVAGLPDRNPFRRWFNAVASMVRRASVSSVARTRAHVADGFAKAGMPLALFNGGGSGSLTFSAQESALTEVTVGSAFLCSHLFDYYSNLTLQPAGFFALQVTRQPAPGFVTCHGGGYVASGSPGWDRVPVPHFPAGLHLLPDEGCGEVQTPLRCDGTVPPAGSAVLFRHAKAGELAEHFSHVSLVALDGTVEQAPTYRGHGWAFG